MRKAIGIVGMTGLVVGCSLFQKHVTLSADDESIVVGKPEIYENSELQAQSDSLRSQLASLGIVNQSALTGALGAIQGGTINQSTVGVQVVGRAMPGIVTTMPSVPGATSSSDTVQVSRPQQAPTIPTASPPSGQSVPALGLSAISLLDQQMQLSSQLAGYELLLTGSDCARYTSSGIQKDHIVIGFPVSISPKMEHENMAAEVQVDYFPPNATQFMNPVEFASANPEDLVTQPSCRASGFSDLPNAVTACAEQEASPTIINILPTERSYNTVGITSKTSTVGAGAIISTLSLGASTSWNRQTQYLVATQDTIASEGAPITCRKTEAEEKEIGCLEGTLGVRFKWQFRPVLGESFVRSGLRRLFVQLAIPYARRQYPKYGGVARIKTTWHSFDSDKGVLDDQDAVPLEGQREGQDQGHDLARVPAPKSEHYKSMAVFGHPFFDAVVSKVDVRDVGGGSIFVVVTGKYLVGASVRIGSTVIGPGSAGFVGSYNLLSFTTTAQAIAQNGAVLMATSGVDTPLIGVSICKAFNRRGECSPDKKKNREEKFVVREISIAPVSDANSLVRVELTKPLNLSEYSYREYARVPNAWYADVAHGGLLVEDVVGASDDRKPGPDPLPLKMPDIGLESLNALPVVVVAGGNTYGFSNLPFEFKSLPDDPGVLAFVATNDSLKASPTLKIQRLFADPAGDSDVVAFVPPGYFTLTKLGREDEQTKSAGASKKVDCSAPSEPCSYELAGVIPEELKVQALPPTPPPRTAPAPSTAVAAGREVRIFAAVTLTKALTHARSLSAASRAREARRSGPLTPPKANERSEMARPRGTSRGWPCRHAAKA